MEEILVTGGAGFLGSRLVETLVSRGHQVTVLDNLADAPVQNLAGVTGQFRFVQADVRDADAYESVATIDTIYHLAANANVPRSVDEPVHDASTNILGTICSIFARS